MNDSLVKPMRQSLQNQKKLSYRESRNNGANSVSFPTEERKKKKKKKSKSKSKKKKSKKLKEKSSKERGKNLRSNFAPEIIRLPSKSRFSDFSSANLESKKSSNFSVSPFSSERPQSPRRLPRNSELPRDTSRKQNLLSSKITSIAIKNNQLFDYQQASASANYSSKDKEKFEILEKLYSKQNDNTDLFAIFSHFHGLDAGACYHQEALITQLKGFTKLTTQYRIEWINTKSVLDSSLIPFLSETGKKFLLSNITSASSCEALLALFNSIVERDILEIKWRLSAITSQELVVEVECFESSDRAKFMENNEIRSLLLKNKINCSEGFLAPPPRVLSCCLSPTSRKRRIAIFLVAVMLVFQKTDPFMALEQEFKANLFLANFASAEFMYFRFVVQRLLKTEDPSMESSATDELQSRMCEIGTLVAKLKEVAKKSWILRRITKDLKKQEKYYSETSVLFFTKEQHDYSASTIGPSSHFGSDKGSSKSLQRQSEEKMVLRFYSKLNREIEKAAKKTKSKETPKKVVDSKLDIERRKEWEVLLWMNLHGSNWFSDLPYMHSLMSFYKSNPLSLLMTFPDKQYSSHEQPMDESIKILSKKYSWVNDDEQTLENFSLSSIFPKNLKCDQSLSQMFVPFRLTPMANLKTPTKESKQPARLTPKLDTSVQEGPVFKRQKSPLFVDQSAQIMKSILKFYKKNKKGISKEVSEDACRGFMPLSLWNQKCIAAILPFAYCDQKDYSLNKHISYCTRFLFGDFSRLGSSLIYLTKVISAISISPTSYKTQARELFARLKFFFNLSNDILCNLSKDAKASNGSSFFSVLVIRVSANFSKKFDDIFKVLEKFPVQESNEDKHEFLIEITSNPNSSAKTPQTWLGSYQVECCSFLKNYLIMWKNKKFVSDDLCKAFDCESESKASFAQFSKNLLEPKFTKLIETEYFLNWKVARKCFGAKLRQNGLRRSVKDFIGLEASVEELAVRSFYCKIKRFQEEASQKRNSAIERGREEGLVKKEMVLKGGLMKVGFVKDYLAFLEQECAEPEKTLPLKRPSTRLDKEIHELEKFLFLTDKCSSGSIAKAKKGQSALKEISHMMKYSNNMENNIQDLNIKSVLEQEFAEKSLQVLGFGEFDSTINDRFGNMLGKRDSEFLGRVVRRKRALQRGAK